MQKLGSLVLPVQGGLEGLFKVNRLPVGVAFEQAHGLAILNVYRWYNQHTPDSNLGGGWGRCRRCGSIPSDVNRPLSKARGNRRV